MYKRQITSQQTVFFQARNALKTVFGRGFAPDPTGGAYDAPPDPLVGWGGGHPLPIPLPSRRLWRLDPQRLRRLDLAAIDSSVLDAFGGSLLDAFGVSFSVYPPLFLAIHHWI